MKVAGLPVSLIPAPLSKGEVRFESHRSDFHA